MQLPDILRQILAQTPALRGACLVGGCVRDWLLGQPTEDFDVEVYGTDYETLQEQLARWGQPNLTGRSFGVIRLRVRDGLELDFSLPRRDSKTGAGHQGFAVQPDPSLDPREAAARRDFTINALAYDPRTGQIRDYFGGQHDLKARVLRHTSPAFVEDPLRVLRGMQLAGRFELTPAPETVALARSIRRAYPELAVERVWAEWTKWAAQSRRPSLGLEFLRQAGWLEHFPEVLRLVGVPQDPEWHPEGDVFTHTCLCCDALAQLPEWQNRPEEDRMVYMLAVLGHDFGKPETTHEVVREGRTRIVSPGHEPLGGSLVARFLERLRAPDIFRQRVPPLVANHLAHLTEATPRSVRRLARELAPETIADLALVITADHYGRPPRPRVVPNGLARLLEVAQQLELEAQAPRPILLGRHLLELGVTPGPAMGKLLKAAFEAQIEGQFRDLEGARSWAAQRLPNPRSDP